MGIETLIGSLVADGTAEANRIRGAALEEADAIVAEARARAEADVAAACASAEAGLRAKVAEALFLARREGRRQVLDARERTLERAKSAALATLRASHDDARLHRAIPALVRNAADYMPEGAATARVHPAVLADVTAALGDRDEISCVADASVAPGVVLEDANGRVQVEETLPVRLERLWPVLRMRVAQAIGEDA